MEKEFELKGSAEKAIVENRLYVGLICGCSDGLILCEKKSFKILMINNNAKILLDLDPAEKAGSVKSILKSEELGRLMEGELLNTEINGMPVKINCAVEEDYISVLQL